MTNHEAKPETIDQAMSRMHHEIGSVAHPELWHEFDDLDVVGVIEQHREWVDSFFGDDNWDEDGRYIGET